MCFVSFLKSCWMQTKIAILLILILIIIVLYVGLSPLPVTVTTRIITFLVGDPYKPPFATVTGRGDNPSCMYIIYFMPIDIPYATLITLRFPAARYSTLDLQRKRGFGHSRKEGASSQI